MLDTRTTRAIRLSTQIYGVGVGRAWTVGGLWMRRTGQDEMIIYEDTDETAVAFRGSLDDAAEWIQRYIITNSA